MKKTEMKIKVIEKPMMNFGDSQKLSEGELNKLKGGEGEEETDAEAQKKKCVVIFDQFKIFDACICYTKRFLAAADEFDPVE
ncbi:MAG: hypothetical protein LBQ28_09070 [Prevotellaceae bacterium]|jgi:hypothetical protein|nr:hypothetical protein [Prevotellaceae bacterium]